MTSFLVCGLSSSVGLCMWDYKSLHVAVMICATPVDGFWPAILRVPTIFW